MVIIDNSVVFPDPEGPTNKSQLSFYEYLNQFLLMLLHDFHFLHNVF